MEGEMKFTKEEIKAVKESIKHWKKDIEKPLLEGQKIIKNENGFLVWLVWENTDTIVKCYGKHCPLCKLVAKNDKDCFACPYLIKHKETCFSLHWSMWKQKPTLRTCQKMIKALEEILK